MSLAIVMWTTGASAEALLEFLNTLPRTFVVFYNPSYGKQYIYDPTNPNSKARWLGTEMRDGIPQQLLSDNLDESVKIVAGDGSDN